MLNVFNFTITMKKQVRILFSSLVVAAACAPALAQNIAVVNGKSIPKARYNFLMQMLKEESAENARPLPPNVEQLIKQRLIEGTVRVQAAEQKKLHLTPEYEERMMQARESVLTELFYKQYLKENPVSDASAKAEYDRVVAAHSNSNAKEFKARHILVKTEAQAQKILADLKKGASFEALAKTHSQDPGSAKRGGDLDWAAANSYVPEFAAALNALRKGETTSKPIKSEFGYHVIRVDDVRTAQAPAFDSVKEQIKKQMQGQRTQEFQEYLQKMQANAKIQ